MVHRHWRRIGEQEHRADPNVKLRADRVLMSCGTFFHLRVRSHYEVPNSFSCVAPGLLFTSSLAGCLLSSATTNISLWF